MGTGMDGQTERRKDIQKHTKQTNIDTRQIDAHISTDTHIRVNRDDVFERERERVKKRHKNIHTSATLGRRRIGSK